MELTRRDFMKLVGISVASLALTRCKSPIGVTCYAPMPPSPTEPGTPRGVLRKDWLSFGDLAQATLEEAEQGGSENLLGQELTASHRGALDELVAGGELEPAVADLVQEAYEAAVYHVWRSNALMTCYEPRIIDYAPESANILVQQSEMLDEYASLGEIDPATLEKAQAAIEHDLAFYALTEEEVNALYDRLVNEWQSQQAGYPEFEELELPITPEAKSAAQFIIKLLIEP